MTLVNSYLTFPKYQSGHTFPQLHKLSIQAYSTFPLLLDGSHSLPSLNTLRFSLSPTLTMLRHPLRRHINTPALNNLTALLMDSSIPSELLTHSKMFAQFHGLTRLRCSSLPNLASYVQHLPPTLVTLELWDGCVGYFTEMEVFRELAKIHTLRFVTYLGSLEDSKRDRLVYVGGRSTWITISSSSVLHNLFTALTRSDGTKVTLTWKPSPANTHQF